LSTINVTISGEQPTALNETNFTEAGSSPYNYTAVYQGDSDGTYTATLNTANDTADNDGSRGESDSVSIDTTAPTVSDFSVTNPSGQNLSIAFNSTEQLNAINVTISGEQSIVLDETDFTTTGTSPYTYTTTYQANSDRTYTATLNTADDFADNDGASGQSESVTVDTIAPTISDFSVTNPSSQNVSVAFNATEQLSTITVSISGAESTILDGRNFAETGSGPYNYTAVYEGDSDGIYTATLNTANDSVDNDGASDQSESVTVDTTPQQYRSSQSRIPRARTFQSLLIRLSSWVRSPSQSLVRSLRPSMRRASPKSAVDHTITLPFMKATVTTPTRPHSTLLPILSAMTVQATSRRA